jgi:hypothetical protein
MDATPHARPTAKDANMGKNLIAQLGVFALLGLNVGAYYVFWPHKEGSAQTESQPKPQPRLVLEKSAAPPKEVPALLVSNPMPLQIDNPPAKPPEPQDDDEQAVRRLLKSIERTQGEVNLPTGATPPQQVAAASPITPQVAPSPWLLNMETINGQTQLIARLKQPIVNQKPALEFRILCDRVEVKSPGAVQAIGKVSVIGAGIKGACQRLTLPLNETQLIFEEQAKITHDYNPGSTLTGERITWEPTLMVEVQPMPRDDRPFNLFPLTPPSLGRPD